MTALVVMAQEFKKGLPLVDGHGNFGSIEGDGAAAMRYTEARLQKITQEAFLSDLDKDVVDFVPNFDETEKEPEVLPVDSKSFGKWLRWHCSRHGDKHTTAQSGRGDRWCDRLH